MTNLDSILKSTDITFPTNVHIIKAMFFPIVMYGCLSWTMKKAECRRIDTFDLWCWRRLLRVPWTARRSNQSILKEINPQYSFSRSGISDSLRPHEPLHTRPPCPSPTPGVYSNSCPLSRDAIQPSHPLSSPSPALNLSQHQGLFKWVSSPSGGPSIGVSASTSVLPMNTQDWSPLGWTDWIFLQSKGLSRVFSNTTVQKHQFFGDELSL